MSNRATRHVAVAQTLFEALESAWRPDLFAEQTSRARQYLVLGVARAHRAVRATLRAHQVEDGEGVFIHVRVLCEVVVRALWIGLPEQDDEREVRRRSYNARYYRERLNLHERWDALGIKVDADERHA